MKGGSRRPPLLYAPFVNMANGCDDCTLSRSNQLIPCSRSSLASFSVDCAGGSRLSNSICAALR